MLQIFSFLLLIMVTVCSYAAAGNMAAQQPLDDEYKKVTTLAYRELANTPSYKLPQADLNTLISEVVRADEAHKPERVIALVVANMATIQKNTNAKELPTVTAVLLKHHAIGIAEDIYQLISNQGDRYSQAKQSFEFAKYEANANHWDKAFDWLKKIDIANELSKENGDEAYIIYGAALQYKKKHREALSYYARVKADSTLYPIAQLNTALGYIRQDWWTDAHISIEQALSTAGKDDVEIVNRLYTTLGFSQLQQGFYRNARDSFRNVKIKSAYANRALLGIGLAALNQEDFVGALNAFNQLKTHSENDMPVAQSYLMAAFTLTRIKQNETASVSYTEAINYYEQKTSFYDGLANEIKTNNPANQTLLVNKILTDIEKEEPEISLLAEELNTLQRLNSYSLSPNTLIQISKLYGNMLPTFLAKTNEVVAKKQLAFNSYLNQSRFGLTKLYDTNN
ncbi:MAG: hypothetical protein V4660_04805 [Pseudomonadota bacterium]